MKRTEGGGAAPVSDIGFHMTVCKWNLWKQVVFIKLEKHHVTAVKVAKFKVTNRYKTFGHIWMILQQIKGINLKYLEHCF